MRTFDLKSIRDWFQLIGGPYNNQIQLLSFIFTRWREKKQHNNTLEQTQVRDTGIAFTRILFIHLLIITIKVNV